MIVLLFTPKNTVFSNRGRIDARSDVRCAPQVFLECLALFQTRTNDGKNPGLQPFFKKKVKTKKKPEHILKKSKLKK